MRPVQKRYLREFIPAMSAYLVLLFASVWLLKNYGNAMAVPLRAVLALLPMLPVVFACRAIVRVIRDSDELERRIDLEAAAIAGMVVGMSYFGLGLLASGSVLALDGETLAIWVFPALCAVFGLAKCWTAWRYYK